MGGKCLGVFDMKSVARLALAGALASALLAPTVISAAAGGGHDRDWRRHRPHHHHSHRWDPGPAILGGAVLGLTLGALANPYYYPPPPPLYAPYPPSHPAYYYDDEHIAYCSAMYRSYDAETDTWVDFNGVIHQCVGPY
jgi:hypothetical protein